VTGLRNLFFFALCLFLPHYQSSALAFEKIPVAVTILPQAYFVERIGGNYADVKAMIPKGMNPETYEPTPQQLISLAKARIYVKIGRDDFPAEKKFLKILVNKKVIPETVSMAANTKQQGQDPHIWVSPSAVKILSHDICGALTRVDPAHKAYYEKNLAFFLQDIDKTDREIRAILAGKEGKSFMVYHPAWGYFAAEYGLKQLAIEEEGKPANLSHMRKIVDLAKKKGINVIFVQKGFDLRSARAVAAEIDARIIETDPLEKDWLANLKNFAKLLQESLK
jgi:zinc transport system substrate-binding protein